MLYIDQIYIPQLGSKLRNFKRVKNDYNFSCPICGDSKKSASKARGWFYQGEEGYSFKCYNCNAPISFYGLFKKLDEELFKEYLFEKKKSNGFVISKRQTETQKLDDITEEIKEVNTDSFFNGVLPVSGLSSSHKAVKYLTGRKIPEDKFSRFFYCPKFISWANQIKPDTYKPGAEKYEHDRLIIPFYDEKGEPFGFAGRAFGDETPKYLIVKIDDSKEKIYGLDTVDFSKKFYVTEGQIDSMLLDNACAVAGASFINFNTIKKNKENAVLCFDNENRSKQIMDALEKSINSGYKVFIWPSNIRAKDFNELVKDYGYPVEKLNKLIDDNTYDGMHARLKFIDWRKV